ncbi:FAD-dependent oxidoreductase [Palleronia sp. LCG004]|uniref:FAD-dependent oxidoreductase n=1 Tax=Palleronia sp. LCG004 TaxID=3079304 RepID=UPI002943DA84|nr:FAD-dependent oxidoreductase [Palleronia sp. LCG004]WOI57860.1 FAD-dependent oxidoreductase [Palleronia sp. LCG004]
MTGKIAIVGAGPSGCYLAQALLKADPTLEVDVLDALPVPYGLLRYGVAADHQGTKGIARQFERVFTRQGARFHGNIDVGRDMPLETLREGFDAVVLAAGLSGDRSLGIPGDTLPGIVGSGALTRALNEHPAAEALPELGPEPMIIGGGNVAMDILRLLSKTPAELAGSDLGPGPTEWLARQRFRKITLVSRSPLAAARFDPAMLKEIVRLSGIALEISDSQPVPPDLLAEHVPGALPVLLNFATVPTSIAPAAQGLDVTVEGSAGPRVLQASAIVTAIGFDHAGGLDRAGLLRECGAATRLAPGLYATGWFANGPSGAIPKARADAQTVAARLLAELRPDPARPGAALLASHEAKVDFSHWERIDARERAAATADRCRRKLTLTEILDMKDMDA